MDEHPIARLSGIVTEESHIDLTPDAGDFDKRQVFALRQNLHNPSRDSQAHAIYSVLLRASMSKLNFNSSFSLSAPPATDASLIR